MALAEDLLAQSRILIALDGPNQKQANLRRGVSSAYYALFHLLVADAVERFAPPSPAGLAGRMARAFAHAEMKQVCRSIADGNLPPVLQPLVHGGFSSELRSVAKTFILLQEGRILADHDTTAYFSEDDSLSFAIEAEHVFAAWKMLRKSDEANVFLSALLFNNRWAK